MNRLVLLVLPLLLISSHRLAGQVDSSRNELFSGKIVDDSLGHPLPSVHLWNESTRMGSISNGSGEFSLKVRNQDTVVFSAIGYLSHVLVVSSSMNQKVVVRLKPKKYEIDEVVVRRFRSYESFLYQATHLDLPESETADLKEHLKVSSIAVALKADRERAIKDKLERFGYTTPLGPGIDPNKAFREKTLRLEKRKRVISAKFDRALVGEITHLDGEDLTEFIALCNFSDDYLYETDLPTIIEDMYAILDEYPYIRDTIPSDNSR